MINSAEVMSALVDSQVKMIADPIVRSALQSFLIPPIKQDREWFYGAPLEKLLCWLVMEDTKSDTGIVYSEVGFGPRNPWGLVFLSKLIIADDAGWFPTLERAFYDSFTASDLKIWNLIKKGDGKIPELIEANLTLDEAYKKRDKLDIYTYFVESRVFLTSE